MNYKIYGAALAAASRLMLKEVKPTEKQQEQLKQLQTQINGLNVIVGDLDARRIGTWVSFVNRLVTHASGTSNQVAVCTWLKERGFTEGEDILPSLWADFARRRPMRTAHTAYNSSAWEMELNEGKLYFYAYQQNKPSVSAFWDEDSAPEPAFPTDAVAREALFVELGDVFWEGRSVMTVDYSNRRISIVEDEIQRHSYHGPLQIHVDNWHKYREAGVRRSILLQGKPGTGKSTFCMHAASSLVDRTLVLSVRAFEAIDGLEWRTLLNITRPGALIIDDVDRASSWELRRKLEFLEEGACDVPFVFLTSNNMDELPDALRRPGRIDQLLVLDDPDDVMFRSIVNRLAAREQTEVPNDRWDELREIAKELSLAHVVEKLRRARIEGWDSPSPCDKTFEFEKDEPSESEETESESDSKSESAA